MEHIHTPFAIQQRAVDGGDTQARGLSRSHDVIFDSMTIKKVLQWPHPQETAATLRFTCRGRSGSVKVSCGNRAHIVSMAANTFRRFEPQKPLVVFDRFLKEKDGLMMFRDESVSYNEANGPYREHWLFGILASFFLDLLGFEALLCSTVIGRRCSDPQQI